MKDIISVTGPIPPEALGFCQCHEHIALSKGAPFRVNPDLCMDDFRRSLAEVEQYRSHGGDTLVEAQPVGCNRVAGWLRSISERTSVNILASTGFHKLIFYPEDHWIRRISPKALTEIFVTELTEGMYLDGNGPELPRVPSDARAGLIKAAYDREQMSPRYLRLFRAAADAALETGCVMMIHVELESNPLLLLRKLLEWGLSPERLMFCHMDRACKDLRLHREILQSGAYLEYDTIGRFKYHSDEHEAQLFQTLIAEGYEDHLLYALDTTRARLKSYTEDAIGLSYILTTFNDTLRSKGISERTIQKISRDNPRRLFSGETTV